MFIFEPGDYIQNIFFSRNFKFKISNDNEISSNNEISNNNEISTLDDISESLTIHLLLGWNLPDEFMDLIHNNLVHTMSSLYSLNGAKLFIRNISRNSRKHIIFLLNNNILGKTELGKAGIVYLISHVPKNVLLIPIETQEQVKEKIIKQIKEIINQIKSINPETISYSEAVFIPKPQIEENKNENPSEYFGFQFYENNFMTAWIKAVNTVIKYGALNHNMNLHELHSLHWSFYAQDDLTIQEIINKYLTVINQPEIINMIGLNYDALKEYSLSFNKPQNQTIINDCVKNTIINNYVSYTYGERLAPYKNWIIEELKQNKASRHCFVTTIKPDKDYAHNTSVFPPCLVYVQFLYDNQHDTLNLYAVFRSHDIFKAALSNSYGLNNMLLEYAKSANLKYGYVEINSISAHIYKSDLYDSRLFIKCINQNLPNPDYLDRRGFCVFPTMNPPTCIIKDYYTQKTIKTITGTKIKIYQELLKIFNNTEHLAYLFNILFKDQEQNA